MENNRFLVVAQEPQNLPLWQAKFDEEVRYVT